MSGFVYLWKNKLNDKKYLGSHQGSIDDNYLGSGILFQKTIRKYGIENFEREILYQGDDFREKEQELLNFFDAQNNSEFYNLKNFSIGGSFPGESNGMFGKTQSDESKKKISESLKSQYQNNERKKIQMFGSDNPSFGKTEHIQAAVQRMKDLKGKSYEEIFGSEKAQEIRNKLKGKRGKSKLKTKICINCGLKGKGPNMSRYHFDNCKEVKK